ncbi:MAG: hypothetical protein ABMA64_29660 [Myxococcota bacterium]
MGLFDVLFAGDGEDSITGTQFEAAVSALAFVGLADGRFSADEQDEMFALVASTLWARELDRRELEEVTTRAFERAALIATADEHDVIDELAVLRDELVAENLCERVLGMGALIAVSEEGRINADEEFALLVLASGFGIGDLQARRIIERALASGAA